MIILSNSLTEKTDEGCLKVANSLAKRIKKLYPETMLVSYGESTNQSDCHLKLNKLFLNRSLISLIRRKKEPVLYIPFSSNTMASVMRVWVLSWFAKYGLKVIFVLRYPMNSVKEKLLRLSGAEVIALSAESYDFFKSIVGHKATYLKTGIDTKQFSPVDDIVAEQLKEKYGMMKDKKVILHVGHLKSGRNVEQLLKISQKYHVFLVTSTLTKDEQDVELRNKLLSQSNITIIDKYIPNIQELYQMADVYFFPVQESGHCIDVPLSVMEAAACNKAIVTTSYGELKAFLGQDGFFFIDSFEENALNDLLDSAVQRNSCDTRSAVLEYDWENSIVNLTK